MPEPVRIGILGDFNPDYRSHHATNESLQHSAHKLGIELEPIWLPTPSLLAPDMPKTLETFDGLWAAPGSPYKSFDGMLKGIQFARVHDWPFLATCGGFQYTLIECARNVLGMKDATTAEEDPTRAHLSSPDPFRKFVFVRVLTWLATTGKRLSRKSISATSK